MRTDISTDLEPDDAKQLRKASTHWLGSHASRVALEKSACRSRSSHTTCSPDRNSLTAPRLKRRRHQLAKVLERTLLLHDDEHPDFGGAHFEVV